MENYLEIIGEWICPDMSLKGDNPLVEWIPEDKYIRLDGNFSANELRALAHYIDPEGE